MSNEYPDPQAVITAWMAQFSKPESWQAWTKMMPEANVNPLGDMLKDTGAKIDPGTVSELQKNYMQEISGLWQNLLASKPPELADKRFAAPAWQANPLAAFNAAAYLVNARFLTALAEGVDAPGKTKQKIGFAVQQMIDAMSPANFLATNPEAQQKIVETKGESLTKGIANMLSDMQKGRISQSNEAAFEVGKNVATTEGMVVFENHLFQLIQYKPLTKTVHQTPLLMIPPCINKFYILDLQPENSLVRYAVEQGNTVFLMSWRNPDESMKQTTWDDYIADGAIKAIQLVQEISGQDKVNTFGFCVGGTILSTALAVLAARGEKPAASVTLLTSMLDFADVGILEVFVDEMQVKLREQSIGHGGLLPGSDLASTFSSLRSNDLVWNYVQSNYLKGNEPPPFDLLYWNADSTNLPGPMFCWYLRNAYLEDSLKIPGKLTVAGEKVDLGAIDAPCFIYASREDHIVPWQSAYASVGILNPQHPENNRFVLGASGHIAGVINPASKNKRSHWINPQSAGDAAQWLERAEQHPGSWWTGWAAFLAEHGGKEVKAPAKYGNAEYVGLEAAPGHYVKVRA